MFFLANIHAIINIMGVDNVVHTRKKTILLFFNEVFFSSSCAAIFFIWICLETMGNSLTRDFGSYFLDNRFDT